MRMFVCGNETIMDEKLKPSLHHTCSRAQTAFILYAPRLFSCHPTISFTLLLPHSSVLLEIAFDSSVSLAAAQGEARECAFTDQQQQWEVERVAGGEGRVSPENTTIRCDKGSHCFGLWEKSPPGEVRLVKQGTS